MTADRRATAGETAGKIAASRQESIKKLAMDDKRAALVEKVARVLLEFYSDEPIAVCDGVAFKAATAVRDLIRAEVLEEAAIRVEALPMIVGIPGLPYERHRNSLEYAAAIRALKDAK